MLRYANESERQKIERVFVAWMNRILDGVYGPVPLDCRALFRAYRSSIRPDDVEGLAEQLGLLPATLDRMLVCYCDALGVFTFPMFNADGVIVGFRTRHPDGAKRAIKGSRQGLFIPTGLTWSGPLLICEGPTDTAAMIGVGFDAIGRPSCSGAVDYVVDVAVKMKAKFGQEVWVVADADGPGVAGAHALADALVGAGVLTRVFSPPRNKDAREWVRGGANYNVIRVIGESRDYWRLAMGAGYAAGEARVRKGRA